MSGHIGIVACSAEGAALCYQTICREAADIMGRHNHPEISIHTHPLSEYMKFIYRNDWKGVAGLILSSAEKLKNSGATFLICPDNTIHEAFLYLKNEISLPWLHIAEEVAKVAEMKGYDNLLVLGTRYLMAGPVYRDILRNKEIRYNIPDEDTRDHIDRIIFDELVYGIIKPDSKNFLLQLIIDFKSRGCNAVVLGCTEIPLIVLPDESALPVLDSTRILARAALRETAGYES
jgi:aspartate racemase